MIDLCDVGSMVLRAMSVYSIAVLFFRIGRRRFLAKPSSYDIILFLMFGSMIGNIIIGAAPFFSTIIIATALFGFHTFLSFLTFHSPLLGTLIKGKPTVLIKDGTIDWANMRKSGITKHDLLSALRCNAQVSNPHEVKVAMLERGGEISVILYERIPHVVEVTVQDNVQKMVIELRQTQ
jgi:uncharacterized membrane protein YcaP (DUF421 family)